MNTGYIDCELTTHTHWFIPDPRKVHKPGDHATLGYFTLDELDADRWTTDPPDVDDSAPAIPGSSLRGIVRSIFETATLSCFSIFDNQRLELRATRLLSPGGYQYIPARVLNAEKDAYLQLLPSKLAGDQVAGGHHRCYQVTGGQQQIRSVSYTGVLIKHPKLKSGSRVVAVVKPNATQHPNPRYFYREATHVFPIPESIAGPQDPNNKLPFLDDAIAEATANGGLIMFGYFCRTGWNIERKHDERVFYASANYNPAEPATDRHAILSRLADFLTDQSVSATAPEAVVSATNQSLAEYAERHRDGLSSAPRDPTSSTDPQLSDYIVKNARLAADDLVYALLDEKNQVVGLYPVCLPRVWHDNTVGDLLPAELQPCSRRSPTTVHDQLCPACRVFGWTRDLTGISTSADSRRVDAVAGHVRFTHATLVGAWDCETSPPVRTTLPILGTPHPSCTEFYLREHPSFSVRNSGRRPPAFTNINRDNIPAYPFAFYRTEEAELRGRKFSRRRKSTDPHSADPARGGLISPPGKEGDVGERGKQNQAVDLLPPGLTFRFRVYFDNLSNAELGALRFSMDLSPPETWSASPGPELFHTIGHGTRLGMGRCSISVRDLHIDDMDAAADTCRYRTLDCITNSNPPNSQSVAERSATARAAFSDTWQVLLNFPAPYGTEFKAIVAELLDMLQIVNGPVHYPNRWDDQMNGPVEYFDSYTWFVANKRGNSHPRRAPGMHPLPNPVDESSDTKRLPIDPAPS